MTRNKKNIIFLIVILIGVNLALNITVSIRQGVDGSYRRIEMPLYVKWVQFLSRHYEYERIAKEITEPCKTDEERALAILKWTHANIKHKPEAMPVVDDHVLNIIIRGYGVPEQYQDVFTALCAYSGMPSFWHKFYDKNKKAKYGISFARINGKWRVFDAYYGAYFTNDKGEIASAEDIRKDNSLVKGQGIDDLYINGIAYRDFYRDLDPGPAILGKTFRPQKQMPFPRMIFEMKKFAGMEKEEPDNGSQ